MARVFYLGSLLLLVVALVAGAIFYARASADALVQTETARFRQEITTALDAALVRQDSAVTALSRRFEQIDDLKTAQESSLRRYRNADHLRTAQALGVGRVSGTAETDRLVDSDRLVRIEDNDIYRIQDLDYSVPYITPDAARLLDEIGSRFQAALQEAGLPRYRYVISSVLRTQENQQALRRINPNATSGPSTHEYGTTLDVVYHTYEYVPQPSDMLKPSGIAFLDERLEPVRVRAYDALGMRYWQELQGMLGRVLIELQEEGAVLVTLEREQPVFHFTVARRLAE